jgi:hypothetical protein
MVKQGQASSSGPGSRKIEPTSRAIDPAGVSQIGETVDPRSVERMHQGRGYSAPKAGHTIHHTGSQGRHDD